ncbi:MAG: peptidoglycan DD-metalloendopeptidase family protein [Campylobacter sputorum]|uniref:peptidoglycan DD-metalloendopeptidase family protein n=1 Tax=Campylobacter sputorum TaxID=206 RepID=UPI001912FAA8|nr:peptidoglycan DD-metalloendopeptidase family protein [Campylobacter sputorum]ASM37235.1 zinc metallopeptidase, M23 family [Campylobacter sputorum bv. faecalis CCUG 20703]ASM38900.1 zinc metallopeptidase, M23 family [Campylobacter sputorum bv. paraureolyticus LMG 11764]MDY6121141.1 peptidoglycan DD-metalloendopeptidase family protein [Campylobacter sputorum]
MRILFIFLLLITFAFCENESNLEELTWPNGETFTNFLENNSLPLKLYYNSSKEDQELLSEISSGTSFQILRDDENMISQVLIPINEELQIHIYKNKENLYELEFIPIIYNEESQVLSIKIQTSPYQDIINETNNKILADAFINVFRKSVDFTKLKKGDSLVIAYTQKRRLGRVFGYPEISSAMIETGGKKYTLFLFEGKYYDESGKTNETLFLIKPVKNARISSRFTKKRFHPILKRYRAHLGVDYAAPKGTPIMAAGNGKVKFVGTKGGYGKTLIISHDYGYETLYAHLNGFAKNIKRGKKVKQGEIVAYIGNTGMSTGPHLHFGLYAGKQAIDPEKVVKIQRDLFKGKTKEQFLALVKDGKKIIDEHLQNPKNPQKEEDFSNFMTL